MALQHLRSSTAHKRPIPTVMSAGQIAINTNEASPGLFFKDSNGDLVKVGPVHIGTTAPNSSPASVAATALVTGTVYQILTVGTSDFTLVGASANTVGTIFTATGTTTGTGTVSGQQGVEKGEQWLDTTGGTYVLKIYDGTDWRSESGTFVDVSGDTMTGDLVMNNANIVFEGATADDFETTLTVTDPTADRTITLPNVTGTVVTTGDTGSVTSTMITDGTIVNADINASAAIAGTKIDPDFGSQTIETTGVFSAADGAASTPSITFTGDTNTGIYRPGADQLAISTNGTQRINIEADGDINIDSGGVFYDATNNRLAIGTTSVSSNLHIRPASGDDSAFTNGIRVERSDTPGQYGLFSYTGGAATITAVETTVSNPVVRFLRSTNGSTTTESLRIDGSGRLLVGTSSARTGYSGNTPEVQIEAAKASDSVRFGLCNNSNGVQDSQILLAKTRGTSVGSNTVVQDGDTLGRIQFLGADGTDLEAAAQILAQVDGTPGNNDMPGRLVFSTTADGASSPTERLRIQSDGNIVALKPYSTALITSPRDIYMDSSGFFGYITSTRDSKTNIAEQSDVSWLYSLNPVTFNYKSIDRETGECSGAEPDTQFGLIAEEVELVCPDICFYDETETGKELRGIDYKKLITPMLKALQQANARIEALEAEVATLKAS